MRIRKKGEYPFCGLAKSNKNYGFSRWALYLTIRDFFTDCPTAIALAETEFEAVSVFVSMGFSIGACYHGMVELCP